MQGLPQWRSANCCNRFVLLLQVYEEHLSDSFAAMLVVEPANNGPVVYFYCLANPSAAATDTTFNAFAAAHHVVLDTSVPFIVVEVSLCQDSKTSSCHGPEEGVLNVPATSGKPIKESKKSLTGSHDTDTTNGEAETHEIFIPAQSQPEDDDHMSICIL
jgi:hypothetical protein